MVGPRPPLCDCRCAQPFPDCFGCEVFTEPYPDHNVQLDAYGFSWLMPETHEGTESIFLLEGFSRGQYETTHRTRSKNIANINGTHQMRIHPALGCSWLWNDVQAVDTAYRHAKSGPSFFTIWEEELYEPLNATDATSPWDRVVGPNDNTTCTYYPNVTCIDGLDCFTAVTLSPQRITITDEANQYFSRSDSGTMYWILDVVVKVSRGAKNEFITSAPGIGEDLHGGIPRVVSPVNFAMNAAYKYSDTSTGPTSIPPYRKFAGASVFFPTGGGVATYGKPIDCTYDFLGNPITLSLMGRDTHTVSRRTNWDVTVPETVEITYAV